MSRPDPAVPPIGVVDAVLRFPRATSAGTIVTRVTTTRSAVTRFSPRVTNASRAEPALTANTTVRPIEADPADLEDDGPDSQGAQEPRDVAVQEERGRQGGHDQRRPPAVTDQVRTDDQRDAARPGRSRRAARRGRSDPVRPGSARTGTGPGTPPAAGDAPGAAGPATAHEARPPLGAVAPEAVLSLVISGLSGG